MNQILIGMLLVAGTGGYLYYNATQSDLESLRKQNQAYELKASQQEETILALQNKHAVQTAALMDLQARNQEIELEMERYLDIFKRHNLSKLAAAKPELIEARVNKGTKEVFDGIEADSASLDSFNDGVQLSAERTPRSKDNN
jgi:cell division protein FtsB